jgi:hypothetical protein
MYKELDSAFTAELDAFTRALSGLGETRLRGVAAAIRSGFVSPADDVAWWRAAIAVEDALRSSGRARVAASAAHQVSVAVTTSAERAGIRLPDADVTCVARAASQLARALVAGSNAGEQADYLARPWRALLRGGPIRQSA